MGSRDLNADAEAQRATSLKPEWTEPRKARGLWGLKSSIGRLDISDSGKTGLTRGYPVDDAFADHDHRGMGTA